MRTGPAGAPPLVFLHPVGLDLTWWGEQIDEFACDHDVIAFDMPVHGLSGKAAAPASFYMMADVLKAVLVQLQTGRVHLVGMSVGGMIAQAFAPREPALVRSLTLVATLCTFVDPVRELLRERARGSRAGNGRNRAAVERALVPPAFRQRRPDVLDRATTSLLSRNAESHASRGDMISGLDLESAIWAIACPTPVVAGTEDGNAPVAAGLKIANAIAGASFEETTGLGG